MRNAQTTRIYLFNKLKTKTMTSNTNMREGYRPVIIASPMEVVDADEQM